MLSFLRRMQTRHFIQPTLNLGRIAQAQPCAVLRTATCRSAYSRAANASRTNIEHAFASVSSVLGFEAAEDTARSQQPRAVTAQATPTLSYGQQEDVTVGEVDFDAGVRNNIQISGNLGRDVEYKVLATNRLANFAVAISNKNREADW